MTDTKREPVGWISSIGWKTLRGETRSATIHDDQKGLHNPIALYSADTIARLEQEIARYVKEDAIKASVNAQLVQRAVAAEANYDGCADTCSRLHARIRTLEAERDNLREALRGLHDALRDHHRGPMCPEIRTAYYAAGALLGGSHDR